MNEELQKDINQWAKSKAADILKKSKASDSAEYLIIEALQAGFKAGIQYQKNSKESLK